MEKGMFGSLVGSRGLASIQFPLSSNLGPVVTDHPPQPHTPGISFLIRKTEVLLQLLQGTWEGGEGSDMQAQ